ncbi:MAG: PilX N-terminal domain-containing pilus assembly protein, partial [Xanthomonadales bacterium]|nr:PilX N-terminal domain-containing pilus assembly protein [Xanthomonadales bacterium]
MTTFTGVMILVLLTLMMFFAMRVGVFEQRVSANESRQKLAFHAAESGIETAKEFFLANTILITSDVEDLLPNGSDGWLADTGEKRWLKCSEAGLDLVNGSGTHPCFGEALPAQRAETYFYSVGGNTALPFDNNVIVPGTAETVRVEALLCVLELDTEADIPVQGCSTDRDVADGSFYMITLLARGEADCNGGADCLAEALVSEQISNFGATSGGNSPDVPLTTKSTFPPSGTAEVVPNPNAGGIGVPISVWMNKNPSCGGNDVDPSSGSWATCEMQEWYGVDAKPNDMKCPPSSVCSCDVDEAISTTKAQVDVLGMDLVEDTNFPCDLFEFYFGVPRANYEVVKG